MYKVTFSLEDISFLPLYITGFLGGSDGKESACNAGDPGLIPGWGRSPGEGNGYSSLVLLEEGVSYDQCVLLAKLLAFALIHSVLQGQIYLLLQENYYVFFDFLLLHSSPLY